MSRLKKKFPLHYTVFRQSSSHLSHEGNVERVFSGAKTSYRADAKMRSSMLRLVTKTGVNKNRYKPTVAAICNLVQIPGEVQRVVDVPKQRQRDRLL